MHLPIPDQISLNYIVVAAVSFVAAVIFLKIYAYRHARIGTPSTQLTLAEHRLDKLNAELKILRQRTASVHLPRSERVAYGSLRDRYSKERKELKRSLPKLRRAACYFELRELRAQSKRYETIIMRTEGRHESLSSYMAEKDRIDRAIEALRRKQHPHILSASQP